jgi:glycosyltransferase involved in cell wall biosynthesis
MVQDLAPDVVHLHSSKAGMAGRLALRRRLPTCFTPHAWSFFHEGALTRWLALRWERFAVRWTDVILCVSEGERRAGEEAGIRARFEVVPNAVDLDRYRPPEPGERETVRTRLGISPDAPVGVCVGRLVDQKGQDVLLRAWTALRERIPDAECILVGDGPNRAELEQLAGPGVRFVGNQEDTRAWLVAADVVVQPSRWEGLSLVALEALASGCSLVTTDVPGMREVVGEGDEAAGAIAPVDDEHALAEAVLARLTNPQLVEVERARARQRAAAHGIDQWGGRVAEALEGLVAARQR